MSYIYSAGKLVLNEDECKHSSFSFFIENNNEEIRFETTKRFSRGRLFRDWSKGRPVENRLSHFVVYFRRSQRVSKTTSQSGEDGERK
jgi:hypothetical protein